MVNSLGEELNSVKIKFERFLVGVDLIYLLLSQNQQFVIVHSK